MLDIAAWGADPRAFEWFEPPPAHALEAAIALLVRLGAADVIGGRVQATPLGRQLQRWPVHVRLARMLLDGRGAPDVAAACALLTEGSARGPGGATTACDLLADLDRFAAQPPSVRRVADELTRLARRELTEAAAVPIGENGLRRALFAGFADRAGPAASRRRRPADAGLGSRRGAGP